jgi:hypothetical protein
VRQVCVGCIPSMSRNRHLSSGLSRSAESNYRLVPKADIIPAINDNRVDGEAIAYGVREV